MERKKNFFLYHFLKFRKKEEKNFIKWKMKMMEYIFEQESAEFINIVAVLVAMRKFIAIVQWHNNLQQLSKCFKFHNFAYTYFLVIFLSILCRGMKKLSLRSYVCAVFSIRPSICLSCFFGSGNLSTLIQH